MPAAKKTVRLTPNKNIVILGYRGDGLARAVRIVEVKDKDLLVCECLLRSSPIHTVYRTYRLAHVNGVMPLVQAHEGAENETRKAAA